MGEPLTIKEFEAASQAVREVARETDLLYSKVLSSQCHNDVYLKLENMQNTGSFKIRGAYYKLCSLTEEERAKGLIAASAGNHALGVAYAAQALGCKTKIFMPATTPFVKVDRTKAYGVEVELYGNDFNETLEYAMKVAKEEDATFIEPFDDLTVATGHGTIAMEIIKELPLVDYIIVPIGGGGLAAGVATLAKTINPHIKVIGVEPAGANCVQRSLKRGELVAMDVWY